MIPTIIVVSRSSFKDFRLPFPFLPFAALPWLIKAFFALLYGLSVFDSASLFLLSLLTIVKILIP